LGVKIINTYDLFLASIKSGQPEKCYIFHGEERYLLERNLSNLRALLCPDGLDSFNYKRFEGKGLTVDELENAIDTFPVFADKTLIEIHDFDIFKNDSKQIICDLLSDLPDYVCIVFIYGTIEYKPDGRQKINKEILTYINVVEFIVQDQDKLIKWIKRHFLDCGKKISSADAEYLAFITGGLMASLNGEIEKTSAYAKGDEITRKDIDSVVTPVLDTVAYKLTDALIDRDNKKALRILDELFQMREAPHKLMYSISVKMRQLLAARICIENNLNKSEFMKMSGIRHEFQARSVFGIAGKTSLPDCRKAVLLCSAASLELNRTSDPEAGITEFITKLALR